MLTSTKKKVLIFIDWFYPGYKAGGPIQSCKNIVSLLKDDFELYIFTSDRDIGDPEPYKNITPDQWSSFDTGIKVFYANASYCTVKNIKAIIKEIEPHTVYINSMFSTSYAIRPLLALKKSDKKIKVVLAPRGMLHKGALRSKKIKKLFFLKALKYTRLTHTTTFHATDKQEKSDIQKYFSSGRDIKLVQNIPNLNPHKMIFCPKKRGEAGFVFISRLHPKKNILYFIELLSFIKDVDVKLDIYCYVDHKQYLEKCKKAIAGLSDNITVNIHDPIPNDKIFDTIGQHHVFVLPTLGENFGHAIFEALSSGRPVLISDQTPWHDLQQQKAGWDIPLENKAEFIKTIHQIAGWSQSEFDEWCIAAYDHAANYISKANIKPAYIDLFS